MSVRFSLLGTDGNGPKVEEISENRANVAARQVNLADISGENAWRNKNWPEECSSVRDAGLNGGGLRSHAWLQKYIA